MDLFTVCLVAFLLLHGVSTFVDNATLATLAGVAAVVAGVIGLVQLVG